MTAALVNALNRIHQLELSLKVTTDNQRARFAGMALQGLLAEVGEVPPEEAAVLAVRMADALLAELEKPRS